MKKQKLWAAFLHSSLFESQSRSSIIGAVCRLSLNWSLVAFHKKYIANQSHVLIKNFAEIEFALNEQTIFSYCKTYILFLLFVHIDFFTYSQKFPLFTMP